MAYMPLYDPKISENSIFQTTNMLSYLNTQNTTKPFITAVSLAASAILLPKLLYILNSSHHFFSEQATIIIEDDQEYGSLNEKFRSIDIYLGTILGSSRNRLRVIRDRDMKKMVSTLDINEEIVDVFENVRVKWRSIFKHVKASEYRREYYIRCYELTFNKKNEERILNSYLPYISKLSKTIMEECKVIRLYPVNNDSGVSEYPFNFEHPITFKTLALDSGIKAMMINDLNKFINGEQFYRTNGMLWRRSYLLYGPAGTGKSSLIAAMANHLKYDIYDFDLSNLFEQDPEFLNTLISNSSSKSLLVVEDLESSIKPQNQEMEDHSANNDKNLVILMELINEAWSSCDNGEILVFTTSDKEMILDPELLMKFSGLIDLQINISHCTISAFNQLGFNHFEIRHHKLYQEIEQLVQKVEVTIGEVARELMKSNDPQVSLQGFIKFLHCKLSEQEKGSTSNQVNL